MNVNGKRGKNALNPCNLRFILCFSLQSFGDAFLYFMLSGVVPFAIK